MFSSSIKIVSGGKERGEGLCRSSTTLGLGPGDSHVDLALVTAPSPSPPHTEQGAETAFDLPLH